MSQSKKKRADKRSVEKAPDSKTIDRDRKRRRTGFIIASVVIVLVGVIVGVSIYLSTAPFRRTIITVDNTSIRMDYFLKRARLAGGGSDTPFLLVEQLTFELFIKQVAPDPPYNIKVTPEDIEQALRETARGESETISDSEFKEWYRQQLNESRLSDDEYRDMVETSLLTMGLHGYLAERVPTVGEQVYLHAIVLETYEDAEKTRARCEAGEDFADLAREVSVDEQTKERGGDLGWLPRGIMESDFDYVAFNLDIGEVSEPLGLTTEEVRYYLLMVSEKAAAREIDEDSLQRLRDKVLDDWLWEERNFHEVSYNFDSEIYAWINWQLAKEQGD